MKILSVNLGEQSYFDRGVSALLIAERDLLTQAMGRQHVALPAVAPGIVSMQLFSGCRLVGQYDIQTDKTTWFVSLGVED